MHGVAFHARSELHNSFVAYFTDQPFQHVPSQVLVRHLASPEPQAGFHFVAIRQEPDHVVPLGDVIVLVHVDAEFHFFQDNLLLVLFRCPFFLFLLI